MNPNAMELQDELYKLRKSVSEFEPLRDVWSDSVGHLVQSAVGVTPSAATSETMETKGLVRIDRYNKQMIPTPLRMNCFLTLFHDLRNNRLSRESNIKPSTACVLFCRAMSDIYRTSQKTEVQKQVKGEDKRVDSVLPQLQSLLTIDSDYIETRQNKHGEFKEPQTEESVPKLDVFTYIKGLGVLLCAQEFKNERFSKTDSDPNSQAAAYIIKWMERNVREVVNNYPVIVVTCTGHEMVVRAVVYSDAASNVLCDTRIFSMEVSEASVDEVACVFHALRKCITSLAEYVIQSYRDALSHPTREFFKQYRYPTLREVEVATGIVMKFKYSNYIDERKSVFIARVTEDSACQPINKDIIVKYIKGSYATAAHQFLASKGFAPTLYAVVDLHYFNWTAVVMEYIDACVKIGGWPSVRDQYKNLERNAIECLHNFGFVHGDLRFQNICYKKEQGVCRVRVIDFDWCGPVGTVRYPATINKNAGIEWHAGVDPETLIEKEHDRHFFNLRYATTATEAESDVALPSQESTEVDASGVEGVTGALADTSLNAEEDN